MAQDEYVSLMASLPALGPILEARYPPINQVRLTSRLNQLRPEHYAQLMATADLLAWSRLPLDGTDEESVRLAKKLIPNLENPTLAKLARDRMELRTLVAALRRRHLGQDTPSRDTDWGYGRFVRRIEAAWREQDFGVGMSFPWINAARICLEKEDAQGLERILLEQAWKQADRVADGHTFNFEAVALYLTRWSLLHRWTIYDAESAEARFSDLVASALTSLEQILDKENLMKEAVS